MESDDNFTYSASGSSVARFTVALVGSDAGSVQALFGADGHTAAVAGRPRVAVATVFNYSALLHRLRSEEKRRQRQQLLSRPKTTTTPRRRR